MLLQQVAGQRDLRPFLLRIQQATRAQAAQAADLDRADDGLDDHFSSPVQRLAALGLSRCPHRGLDRACDVGFSVGWWLCIIVRGPRWRDVDIDAASLRMSRIRIGKELPRSPSLARHQRMDRQPTASARSGHGLLLCRIPSTWHALHVSLATHLGAAASAKACESAAYPASWIARLAAQPGTASAA